MLIRTIVFSAIFFTCICFAFFAGFKKTEEPKAKSTKVSPLISGIAPERDCRWIEDLSFAVVLYAHNASYWCEKALRSIFEQDYPNYRVFLIDDGSVDDTFDKVQQFILDNKQEHRVIAMRNESTLGYTASLYRAVDNCLSREIILPLNAQDWLVHENTLTRLNQVFQNPDNWIVLGQFIQYPSYKISELCIPERSLIEKKGFQIFPDLEGVPIAFYASLFHSVPLSNLYTKQTAFISLFEKAGGRFRLLPEPLIFSNTAVPQKECSRMKLEAATPPSYLPCLPLTHFPCEPLQSQEPDIILCSNDSPIQLYAALESIDRYCTGYKTISVIYSAHNREFEEAYRTVRTVFPTVQYIKQGNESGHAFKDQLITSLCDFSSEYVLFSTDDLILKDFVDLKQCQQILRKTGADGFFLSFNHTMNGFPSEEDTRYLPLNLALNNGICFRGFTSHAKDQAPINNFNMNLYRKSDLKNFVKNLKYKDFNSFKIAWKQARFPIEFGLYFEQPKTLILPLNSQEMTANDLLLKFNEGFKIDIDPLCKTEDTESILRNTEKLEFGPRQGQVPSQS